MVALIVGWTVRTHDGVRERLWWVGAPDRDKAEKIAASAAHAGSQAVSPLTRGDETIRHLSPGTVSEIRQRHREGGAAPKLVEFQ